MVELIAACHAETGACRIIDLGGEANYWRLFDRSMLADKGVHITLVNPGGVNDVWDADLFTVVGDPSRRVRFTRDETGRVTTMDSLGLGGPGPRARRTD